MNTERGFSKRIVLSRLRLVEFKPLRSYLFIEILKQKPKLNRATVSKEKELFFSFFLPSIQSLMSHPIIYKKKEKKKERSEKLFSTFSKSNC